MAGVKFLDSGAGLHDFSDEILVVCPTCDGCARTFRIDRASKDIFAPRRFVCSCGHTKDWATGSVGGDKRASEPTDGYFGLPLWLRVRFSDGTLWAYNREHLAVMQAFVQAKLRERRRDPKFGWFNRSFLGRLPAWIKSAKNREVILRRLQRLHAMLPEDERG